MNGRDFNFSVDFSHRIRFSRGVFDHANKIWNGLLETNGNARILVFLDRQVAETFPGLENKITRFVNGLKGFTPTETLTLQGGEQAKLGRKTLEAAWDAIERNGIDRHSYAFCVGGGAFLDAIGLAAATAHRGVRLVRFPTTVLAQDDSGVGVKCGVNAYGKKNFIGAFAVPYAVVNDFEFLDRQPDAERRAGLVEAVKVGLVKDKTFFEWMETNADSLGRLEREPLEKAVEKSAMLHAEHIAGGSDPFENGSQRPLDYGHWAAHKLEQMTGFHLGHGEAVSVGVTLDTLYSVRSGLLPASDGERVLFLLERLGLPVWNEALRKLDGNGRRILFSGLEEFREHLGGKLTVILLNALGRGTEVHALDENLLDKCLREMQQRSAGSSRKPFPLSPVS